jgi:hypothetical protein
MATRWEAVVALANEVDGACAAAGQPDGTTVARLARAVLDFQKEMEGGAVARSTRSLPPATPAED